MAELLDYYSHEQMISFHKAKYPNQMHGISIPFVLTYIADADESEDPVTLKIKINWIEVKKIINKSVSDFF